MNSALNPKAEVSLRHIGRERQPVLVIDNLFLDADELVAAAVAVAWGPPQGTYYPGLNAPLPEAYLPQVLSALRPSLGRAFGFSPDARVMADGFFALATWGLEQFGPWQRIPHYDQPHPGHLAMVHYLNADQGGGTGFFRHSLSGFESIDTARRAGYLAQTTDWLDAHAHELTGFAGPDTPGYEMHGHVAFRFNRAVIYPSCVLHCALFDGAHLSADPRQGRLTANSFFYPA